MNSLEVTQEPQRLPSWIYSEAFIYLSEYYPADTIAHTMRNFTESYGENAALEALVNVHREKLQENKESRSIQDVLNFIKDQTKY
jgi:hypothetical protein